LNKEFSLCNLRQSLDESL